MKLIPETDRDQFFEKNSAAVMTAGKCFPTFYAICIDILIRI